VKKLNNEGGKDMGEETSKAQEKVNHHLERSKKKDRTFVRAIEGPYNLQDELDRLRSLPRVIKAKEKGWHGGPQYYGKRYIDPSSGMGQTLHIHLEDFSPSGKSNKHGHVNEACFYILDGEGYEIHDEVRYDWKAGDVVVVPNNCVHQHHNASRTKPARALVIKTKPMYLFMNMLFQKLVEPSPSEPTPEGVGFVPRNEGDK